MAKDRIEISEPQFNVPVVQLPSPGTAQADALGAIAKFGQTAYETLDKKRQEDGELAALQAASEFRMKTFERINRDKADGKIDDGYTGQVDDELQAYVKDYVSNSDNPYEKRAFSKHMFEVQKDIHYTTTAEENSVRRARNYLKADNIMRSNIRTVELDPTQYEKLYQENQRQIEKFTDLDIIKELNKRQDEMSQGRIERVIQDDPYKALEALTGKDAAKLRLPEGSLPTYINRARDEIRQRESEARQKKTLAQIGDYEEAKNVDENINALMRATGRQPTHEDLQALRAGYTDKRYARAMTDLKQSQNYFNTVGDIAKQPMTEINRRLAAAFPTYEKEKTTGIPFVEQQKLFNEIKQAREVADTLRTNNPGLAGIDANPLAREAWSFYDQNRTMASLQHATDQTILGQKMLGIDEDRIQVMEQDRAAGIANRLNTLPPGDAGKELAALERDLGPKKWNMLFRQAGTKLDAEMYVAPMIRDPAAQAALIEGSREPAETLVKASGTQNEGRMSVRSRLANNRSLTQMMTSLEQREGGGIMSGKVLQAATTLALKRMAMKGGGGPDAAMQYAIENIVTGNYVFLQSGSNAAFRMPKVYHDQKPKELPPDGSKIEYMSRFMRNHVADKLGGLIDFRHTDPAQTEASERATFLANLRDQGSWETNDDETGIALTINGIPITIGGQEVQYSFRDLQNTPVTEGGGQSITAPFGAPVLRMIDEKDIPKPMLKKDVGAIPARMGKPSAAASGPTATPLKDVPPPKPAPPVDFTPPTFTFDRDPEEEEDTGEKQPGFR